MPNMLCTVAIPTRELFDGEIAYAEIPGAEGNYGVMAGHEMLLTSNRPGILTLWLDPEGKEKRRFATLYGHAQVYQNRVTILARMGHDLETIDFEHARKRAEEMRAEIAELEKDPSGVHAATLETSRIRLEWYEFQLSLEGKVS